jgi:cyanate lyase
MGVDCLLHPVYFLAKPSVRRLIPGQSAVRRPIRTLARRLLLPLHTQREMDMKRTDLTEKILDIKRENAWTWAHISSEIGGMSPMLITAALLGQMKLPRPLAAKAAALFGLTRVEEAMLNEVPYRGSISSMPPTDPLIYRLYEMVMVYGTTFKELIQEEFGDGIMSAIDFNMDMKREPNDKGDRVKLTLSGKFLPYKYYGNEQGIPDYGFKE